MMAKFVDKRKLVLGKTLKPALKVGLERAAGGLGVEQFVFGTGRAAQVLDGPLMKLARAGVKGQQEVSRILRDRTVGGWLKAHSGEAWKAIKNKKSTLLGMKAKDFAEAGFPMGMKAGGVKAGMAVGEAAKVPGMLSRRIPLGVALPLVLLVGSYLWNKWWTQPNKDERMLELYSRSVSEQLKGMREGPNPMIVGALEKSVAAKKAALYGSSGEEAVAPPTPLSQGNWQMIGGGSPEPGMGGVVGE